MKPDWKDAPEWAKFLAMDDDGEWWWYEVAPEWETYRWEAVGGYAMKHSHWLDVRSRGLGNGSLEPRP